MNWPGMTRPTLWQTIQPPTPADAPQPTIKHPLPIGTLLQTVKGAEQGDWDMHHDGRGNEVERRSRPGETGRILYANHSEAQGWTYGVEFQECRAWVHIDEAEINDPSQYILLAGGQERPANG
jgi:hypothetical protein